jgi:protocatechuate 3,4-dioxygenase beta subunit
MPHSLAPKRCLLASLLAVLCLTSIPSIRFVFANPSGPSDDKSNQSLDPQEGRDSYLRRLKQAELTKPGHVADLAGNPIAGAVVKRQGTDWTATTDAAGSFPLPDLKPDEWSNLVVSAPGFFTLDCISYGRDSQGEYHISDSWPIHMPRVASVSGRVLGPDGKPLAGAPLSIDTWVHMPAYSSTAGGFKEVVTDKDGQFTFQGIPPGSHAIYYPSHAPTSVPAKSVCGSIIVEPQDGRNIADLTMDLSQSTAAVEGQVLGPDGKPLAGTKVLLSRYHQWKDGSTDGTTGPNPTATTDAQGHFKLTGIGPGQWQLQPSHPHYHRPSPTQRLTLTSGQSVCQNLRVTIRNDAENNISRAADDAERTDDLKKINRCYYGVCLPVVTQNLAESGQLTFLSLAPGQIDEARVELKSLGLPNTAKPEDVAKTAHVGELYLLAPNKLVTVNGTIVAPFTPPANEPNWQFPGWQTPIKRVELVKQVEESRQKNPDADGRRITVEDEKEYIVVRDDGRAFLMHMRVNSQNLNPSFLYIGRLKLKPKPDAPAKPSASK